MSKFLKKKTDTSEKDVKSKKDSEKKKANKNQKAGKKKKPIEVLKVGLCMFLATSMILSLVGGILSVFNSSIYFQYLKDVQGQPSIEGKLEFEGNLEDIEGNVEGNVEGNIEGNVEESSN